MSADLDVLSLALLAACGAVGVASIGFLIWILRCESADVAAGRARMEAASARLRAVLHESTMREALVEMHVATSDTHNIDAATHSADSAAQWAARLFARLGGGRGADLSFDGGLGHWTCSVPLFAGGPPVSFSLPDIAEDRPDRALLAAVEVVAGDSVPISCEDNPGEVAVRYGEHGWQAFAPCDECGGQWLETYLADTNLLPIARTMAREHLVAPDRDADDDEDGPPEPRECPGCVAAHVRSSPNLSGHPFVWFDTGGGGWMLSRPFGEDDSICLPLGIASYFVNHGAVSAAASRRLEW